MGAFTDNLIVLSSQMPSLQPHYPNRLWERRKYRLHVNDITADYSQKEIKPGELTE